MQFFNNSERYQNKRMNYIIFLFLIKDRSYLLIPTPNDHFGLKNTLKKSVILNSGLHGSVRACGHLMVRKSHYHPFVPYNRYGYLVLAKVVPRLDCPSVAASAIVQQVSLETFLILSMNNFVLL